MKTIEGLLPQLESLQVFLSELDLEFAIHVLRYVSYVVLIAVVFRWSSLVISPPSSASRYRTAKNLYRRGQIQRALNLWTAMIEFGPAYLSLATHALYVEYNPEKTLAIIRRAKQEKVRINISQVDMIRKDAKALESAGSLRVMIEINGRMARQDHLGITDP